MRRHAVTFDTFDTRNASGTSRLTARFEQVPLGMLTMTRYRNSSPTTDVAQLPAALSPLQSASNAEVTSHA